MEIIKRPYLPDLYWVIEVSGNAYISTGETADSLDLMLWGKNSVKFSVSLRGVKQVSDLVYKIEKSEKNGDINIYCFPTAEDQLKFVMETYGEIW